MEAKFNERESELTLIKAELIQSRLDGEKEQDKATITLTDTLRRESALSR